MDFQEELIGMPFAGGVKSILKPLFKLLAEPPGFSEPRLERLQARKPESRKQKHL